MDNVKIENDHYLEQRLKTFAEFNPSPIILLNFLGEIVFVNLSARTQFPTLTSLGSHHPILLLLFQQLKKMMPINNETVIWSQDINYLNSVFEQQIFVLQNQNTIFINMYDVTDKKQLEDETQFLNQHLEQRINDIIEKTTLLLGTQLTNEQKDIIEAIQHSYKNLLSK
jgi:hypothetical protein